MITFLTAKLNKLFKQLNINKREVSALLKLKKTLYHFNKNDNIYESKAQELRLSDEHSQIDYNIE